MREPFKNESERREYFDLAIASERRRIDDINRTIEFYLRRKPGGAPGCGNYDTAEGIRSALRKAKAERSQCIKNLAKLQRGIPLFEAIQPEEAREKFIAVGQGPPGMQVKVTRKSRAEALQAATAKYKSSFGGYPATVYIYDKDERLIASHPGDPKWRT